MLAVGGIEQLADVALNAIEHKDKGICMHAVDTLGELANMVTGAATSVLNSNDDLNLMVTTPAVIVGSNVNISFVSTPTIGLSLYSGGGPIEINIALE